MDFLDKVNKIKGVGEKTNLLLNKLSITNIKDLLEYYPINYDEFKNPLPISELIEGETVAIMGRITCSPRIKKIKNLQIIEAKLKDNSGMINLTWYNMTYLIHTLKMAYTYIFRGKLVRKNNYLFMEQAKIYERDEYYNKLHVLQPIYSLTKGITSNSLSKFIKLALSEIKDFNEYLDRDILKSHNLLKREQAYYNIHFPKTRQEMIRARERLVFDEFFLYILGIRNLKSKKDNIANTYIIKDFTLADKIIKDLPFTLTSSQIKVWNEVKNDLSSNKSMNRLIQGDVGSGKTIIAALSMLSIVIKGSQAAIMAPTEILARQHYETFEKLFSNFNVNITLLLGSMSIKEKRETYNKIKNGDFDIIIGTHALIQDKVEYKNLGLIVIDEQHRFGVKQRQILSLKGNNPHILLMSATPIPRTLAIILYGDYNISIIDELPKERLPIKNAIVNNSHRDAVYKLILQQVSMGHQAYIICPMIEESESLEVENVIDYTENLKGHLQGVKIDYLHGKMKANEKNLVMDKFAKGEIKILVSTTVIEVGVNVANATLMIVENAERFGLAQLHQLRGRVGRSKYQSYCLFFCGKETKIAKKRLEILKNSNDGFFVANEDLRLRGPGDLFGIIQSGDLEFKTADIYNDSKILKMANEVASSLSEDKIKNILNNRYLFESEVSL